MRTRSSESRHNCTPQVPVLHEPFIKGHQLEIGCRRESCQVGIGPYVCGKRLKLSVHSQLPLDSIGFFRKANSFVRRDFIVESPGLVHRYCVDRKRFEIGRQPQKSQLRDTAKKDTARCSQLHPIPGRGVMLLRFECQSQPEINIGQEHPKLASMRRCPLLPESQRSARSSDRYFPVHLRVSKETQHVLDTWRNERLETIVQRPSPQHLRAASSDHQAQPHHFERVLGFPCPNSSAMPHQNQHLIHCY